MRRYCTLHLWYDSGGMNTSRIVDHQPDVGMKKRAPTAGANGGLLLGVAVADCGELGAPEVGPEREIRG